MRLLEESGAGGVPLLFDFNKFSKVKVCLILCCTDESGKILVPLFSRAAGGDQWFDLPGGKIDPDENGMPETPENAARREADEELGIDDLVMQAVLSDSLVHPKTSDTTRRYMICHSASGKIPINKEHGTCQNTGMILVDPARVVDLVNDRLTEEARKALLLLSVRQPS